MIKASELRIGNYIVYYSDTIILNEQEFYNIIGGNDFYNLFPIHLTEEWLNRFELNNRKLKVGRDADDFINNQFSVLFGGGLLKVQYVHQLQNLYFALTGEELTVKE